MSCTGEYVFQVLFDGEDIVKDVQQARETQFGKVQLVVRENCKLEAFIVYADGSVTKDQSGNRMPNVHTNHKGLLGTGKLGGWGTSQGGSLSLKEV